MLLNAKSASRTREERSRVVGSAVGEESLSLEEEDDDVCF